MSLPSHSGLYRNGNGRLSLDGYFVHQQSVIQHLLRCRALSVSLRMIRMLKSWPLRIAPAHSRVGEGARLLQRKQIVWLRTACRRNAAEWRKLLKSVLHGCRAFALTRCDDCWMKIIQAGTQQKTLQVFGPQLADIGRTPQDQVNIYTVLTAPPCNIQIQ